MRVPGRMHARGRRFAASCTHIPAAARRASDACLHRRRDAALPRRCGQRAMIECDGRAATRPIRTGKPVAHASRLWSGKTVIAAAQTMGDARRRCGFRLRAAITAVREPCVLNVVAHARAWQIGKAQFFWRAGFRASCRSSGVCSAPVQAGTFKKNAAILS
jgi:hypothetical protein